MFIIGEYVTRKIDGAVGKVVEIQEYSGGHVYKVDLGRVPLEGLDNDEWIGAEDAWTPVLRLHAHVTNRSRDCDGQYTSGHVVLLTAEERCSEFADLDFKHRVISSLVSPYAEQGTLDVRSGAVVWSEITDEGFRESVAEWCEYDDADDNSWQRDHSAEAAGY